MNWEQILSTVGIVIGIIGALAGAVAAFYYLTREDIVDLKQALEKIDANHREDVKRMEDHHRESINKMDEKLFRMGEQWAYLLDRLLTKDNASKAA